MRILSPCYGTITTYGIPVWFSFFTPSTPTLLCPARWVQMPYSIAAWSWMPFATVTALSATTCPPSTSGFSFTAHGLQQVAQMGDELDRKGGVTIKIRLPRRTECVLFKDGKPVKTWHNHDLCTYITTERGVYRLEVFIDYLGMRHGVDIQQPDLCHLGLLGKIYFQNIKIPNY